MCGGGAPKAPAHEAPPPAAPPELRLTGEQAAAETKRKNKKTLATGRASLVSPGLALGKRAATAATGALAMGGGARRGKK